MFAFEGAGKAGDRPDTEITGDDVDEGELIEVVVFGFVTSGFPAALHEMSIPELPGKILAALQKIQGAHVADLEIPGRAFFLGPTIAIDLADRQHRFEQGALAEEGGVTTPEVVIAVAAVGAFLFEAAVFEFPFEFVVAIRRKQSLDRQVLLRPQVEAHFAQHIPIGGPAATANFGLFLFLTSELEHEIEPAPAGGREVGAIFPTTAGGAPRVQQADANLIGATIWTEGLEVEHTRTAVAIFDRKPAGKEVDAAEHFRIDDAEDALIVLEVVRLEDLQAIDFKADLPRQTASDSKFGRRVIRGHTRQDPDRADDVVAEMRQLAQVLGGEGGRTSGCVAADRIAADNVDRVEGDRGKADE